MPISDYAVPHNIRWLGGNVCVLLHLDACFAVSEGFVKYIRKEHKDAFNEFCYKFTGRSRMYVRMYV